MSTRASGGAVTAPSRDTGTAPPSRSPLSKRVASGMAFNKIGAVYVWILIIIIFSIWVPDTFPTINTVKQILNSNAITGLAALAITIPLAARVFDLSFAYVMTLPGVAVAKLVIGGTALFLAVLIGVGIGIAIGFINALVVVVASIDSFIGTLATGS